MAELSWKERFILWLWMVFRSLFVGSIVFWITTFVFRESLWINIGLNSIFGKPIGGFIYFLSPAIPAGYAVSKTYSKGLIGLAIVGLISPYFLAIPFFWLLFIVADANYIFLIPIVSMFSALFFKKEFRDKIRRR